LLYETRKTHSWTLMGSRTPG